MQHDRSPGVRVRATAARVVAAVFAGSNLDTTLDRTLSGLPPADAALVRAIAYGVLRQRRCLEASAQLLLSNTRRPQPLVWALLLVGLHQLRAMRVPGYAAVSATVAAAGELGHPAARGLINAVLRRYLREHRAVDAALPAAPGVRLSYPDWLAAALRKDWPRSWRRVLEAGNEPGPLVLRVNRRCGSREDYLLELEKYGLTATAVEHAPEAVRLVEPLAVERIPGFETGVVSVQDAGAQFAASLLDARPGHRVLDACAAPGGKSAHLLETVDEIELVALDVDAQRQQRTQQTLSRLGLHAETLVGDARHPARWWDGRPFQRILVDAPCSATGVIRRHPDIKWLRRRNDIPELAGRQRALLDALWPLLDAGGILLYVTCSILDAEGVQVAASFLQRQPDAAELPIDGGWGEAAAIGRRLPPGGDFDGFFYARIRKTSAA